MQTHNCRTDRMWSPAVQHSLSETTLVVSIEGQPVHQIIAAALLQLLTTQMSLRSLCACRPSCTDAYLRCTDFSHCAVI